MKFEASSKQKLSLEQVSETEEGDLELHENFVKGLPVDRNTNDLPSSLSESFGV
jgi:hypothetical protein